MTRHAAAMFLATVAACSPFNGSDSTATAPDGGASDAGAEAASATAEGGQPPTDEAGACLPPTPNIVAWWTGDGTSKDQVGQFPLSAAGPSAFSYSTGEVAQAFDFRAGSASAASPGDPLMGASAFTIELWIQTQGDGRVLGNHDGTNGYVLDIANGSPRLTINASAVSATIGAPIGAWTHVAAVWGGNIATLYVNGEAASVPIAATPPGTSTESFLIAADSKLGLPHVAALLDEITLHTRALAPAEIKAIVAAGASGRCK